MGKTIRSRALPLHVFSASGVVDPIAGPICDCGSAERASVHQMPEVSDEARAMEARKMGER